MRNVRYAKCPLFEMSVYEMSANRYKQARFACLRCGAGGHFVSSAPGLTFINYKGDNISKYVCLTVKFDITRKITKIVNFCCVMMTS